MVNDFIEYLISSQNIFPIRNIDQSKPNYNEHANFEEVAYDSSSGEFKLNLKTLMILPGGSRLAFKHNGTPTENHTVTYKVIYREV